MLTKDHIDAEIPDLTVQQLNAIDLLVSGFKDKETANYVGVTRETITRWRLYNPKFRAELNYRRKQLLNACMDKMRHLLYQSLDVIEMELAQSGSGKRKVALETMKVLLEYKGSIDQVGATTPEQIIHDDASPDFADLFGPEEKDELKALASCKEKLTENDQLH